MVNRAKGFLGLVLHAHIPYVLAHGRWPHGMDWLCEAVAESYLPLLACLRRLVAGGVSPRITISFTPVLCEQLADAGFAEELRTYLNQRIASAREAQRHFSSSGQEEMAPLAALWERFYEEQLRFFDELEGDILAAFKQLQDEGHIELIASAATHAYFPLLGRDTSIQAQVLQGIRCYERFFGRKPRGFWLPECAYRPRYRWRPPQGTTDEPEPPAVLRKGVDEFLSEAGIEFFFVDAHLLRGGEAVGVYRERFEALARLWQQFAEQYQPRELDREKDPLRPYLVCSAGAGQAPVTVLAREHDVGMQVWSAERGYPGDGNYLDFHKKYFPGGLRLWRVTDWKLDLGAKLPYDPDAARSRIPEHAAHFVSISKGALLWELDKVGTPRLLCCPFDAELFGHWWFEGIQWLEQMLRRLAADEDIASATVSYYLEHFPATTVVSLPEGSWGEGGYHYIWLNEWTTWTWRHIYACEDAFAEVLRQAPKPLPELAERILRQAARELLLLQSSDWQFLISTWNARDYAEMRFDGHLQAFNRLLAMGRTALSGGSVRDADLRFLAAAEQRDRLFPDVQLDWFSALQYPAQ